MVYFPTEIIDNILCRLPIEAALQAKKVCKTWNILLRKKTDKVGLLFAESYFDEKRNKLYYGDEYDPIRGKMNYNNSYDNGLDKMRHDKYFTGYGYMNNMVGSCNGLVCVRSRYPEFVKPFLICNPITGEVDYIPKPDKSITPNCKPTNMSGFGYCHSKNEYKIVRMHYQGQKRSHVLVYTVGSGSVWRSKGFIPIGSIHVSPLNSAGIYANGALHWLYRNNNKKQKDYSIMAFDLESEKFEFIHLQHFKDLKYVHGPKLLGGRNLYLVYTIFHHQHYCTQVWANKRENNNNSDGRDLKENYNDKDSWHWIKEYSIKWEETYWEDLKFYELLAVTRNKEFLLRYKCKTLYCYDFKTSTMKKLFDGHATGCMMINVIPHANSTVSMSLKKS